MATNVNRIGGGGRWRNGYWTQRTVLLLGEESKMKMDRKYVVRRRVVAAVVFALVISLFTYATRDVCYVGKDGNLFGYGSCSEMIDKVIGEANK